MSQLEEVQAEGNFSYLPSYSIKAFHGLDKAHPNWGRQPALLSLQIQMLISSRKVITDTPILRLDLLSGHPVAQSSRHKELTITIDVKKMNWSKNMFTLLPGCAILPLEPKDDVFFNLSIVSTIVYVYWFCKVNFHFYYIPVEQSFRRCWFLRMWRIHYAKGRIKNYTWQLQV